MAVQFENDSILGKPVGYLIYKLYKVSANLLKGESSHSANCRHSSSLCAYAFEFRILTEILESVAVTVAIAAVTTVATTATAD